jgi:hypothetical protein
MGFFRSINGGVNWTNISSGLPNRYPTDIGVNPLKSSEVYAVFSGFGTPHVYKTINYGSSWINVSGNLPDIPFQAVIVDPVFTNHVYVGNDFGVYVSTNGGTDWNSFTDGLTPAVMVFDLSISLSNRKIRAVTHGNGVFERKLLDGSVGIISSSSNIPEEFTLYQNYPNPFNPLTHLEFGISKLEFVSLKVFDILGKEVMTLVNETKPAGKYSVTFDGSNLSSGIYFYKIEAGDFIKVKRMALIK